MLRIDTNWAIRMNRGDDVSFPFFLNKGTVAEPIRYEFKAGDGCELYFYIMHVNQNPDCPIKQLTFTSDDNLYIDPQTGKPNGDILIRLKTTDTADLPEGEYRYQVKAKIIDESQENLGYSINTVTNRLPLIIVDSDYNYNFVYR